MMKYLRTLAAVLMMLATISGCAELIGLEKPDDDGPGADAGDPTDRGNPVEIPGALPLDEDRRVFVTFERYSGALGGLAGADAVCQSDADASNLGGVWRAWLADGQDSPATRFVRGQNDYENLLGEVIAQNWDDLVDGMLTLPINVTAERGGSVGPVWSNVAITGESASASPEATCDGWTRSQGSGAVGRGGEADARWTQLAEAPLNCDSTFTALYCFEQ